MGNKLVIRIPWTKETEAIYSRTLLGFKQKVVQQGTGRYMAFLTRDGVSIFIHTFPYKEEATKACNDALFLHLGDVLEVVEEEKYQSPAKRKYELSWEIHEVSTGKPEGSGRKTIEAADSIDIISEVMGIK